MQIVGVYFILRGQRKEVESERQDLGRWGVHSSPDFDFLGQEQNPHSANSPLPLPIKWEILQIKRAYVKRSNPKMLRENEHSLNKVCIIKSFASFKALYKCQLIACLSLVPSLCPNFLFLIPCHLTLSPIPLPPGLHLLPLFYNSIISHHIRSLLFSNILRYVSATGPLHCLLSA